MDPDRLPRPFHGRWPVLVVAVPGPLGVVTAGLPCWEGRGVLAYFAGPCRSRGEGKRFRYFA